MVLVPLIVFVALLQWAHPWALWTTTIVAEGLWIWAGFRLVIRPNQPESRSRIIAVAIVLGIFILVHPWVLGIQGRINEYRFGQMLRSGMSRAEVRDLETNLGATQNPCCIMDSPVARFDDFVFFCYVSGTQYILSFKGRHYSLGNWTAEKWTDRCATAK